MRIINKIILSLAALIVIVTQTCAAQDLTLKEYWKPVPELSVAVVRKASPSVLLCGGSLDSNSRPFIGHIGVDPEEGAVFCKYSKFEDNGASARKEYDSATTEWLDIPYQQLLAWLEKHAARRNGSNDEVFFSFTYHEITGSTSVVERDDVTICAQWTRKETLDFGYQVTGSNGLKECQLATKARYMPSDLPWYHGFYRASQNCWSAIGHTGYCKATEIWDNSNVSKKDCLKMAHENAKAKGFCSDAPDGGSGEEKGACGIITDICDTSDDGAGRNRCYFKEGRKEDLRNCRINIRL